MLFLPFLVVSAMMLAGVVYWIVVSSKQALLLKLAFPKYAVWFGLLLILGFQLGLYGTLMTQSFPAMGLLVFGLSTAVAWLVLQWQRRSLLFFVVLAVIVLSSLLMPWRASGFVQLTNVLMLFGANALLFLRLIRGAFPRSLSRLLSDAASVSVRSVGQMLAVTQWLRTKQQEGSSHGIFGWLKTIAIAAIGAIVFLFLLSQADVVFASLVGQVRDQVVGRLIWTALLGFVITIAVSFTQSSENEALKLRWFNRRDALVLLGTIGVIIAAFLVVQWQYVFGSSRELLSKLDLSYSEYVRRGFIELLLATAVGGAVSYAVALKLRVASFHSNRMKALLVANAVVLVELLLLLVSAYKRNALYVDVYGLTRVRIIGEVFLGWLACMVAVLFVLSVWRQFKERSAMVIMGLVTVVAWLGLQVVNVDALIARGAPEHQAYTDYFYIMQLSEDAAREQFELLPDVVAETQQLLLEPTLSENQQAQLAGLKLALLSFAEHRDKLYFHYENEATLLGRWNFFGDQWPENFRCSGLDKRLGYLDSCSSSDRALSDRMKTERGWQFFSPTKQAAYNQIVSSDQLENLAFSIEDRVREIEQYQVDHQLDLYEQEHRLLHDFSYPFIFVRLRTYSPRPLAELVREIVPLNPTETFVLPTQIPQVKTGVMLATPTPASFKPAAPSP